MGAPLAGLIVGSLIGLEANMLDVREWLLLSAFFDLAALVPFSRSHHVKQPVPLNEQTEPLKTMISTANHSLKKYVCSRQFRFWIGVLISAKVVVLTLVTFYWKVSINDFFAGNENRMTRYFGIFYACTGMLTLLVQGLLTSQLISRRTSFLPVLVLPLSLTLLFALLSFGGGALFFLVIATLAKSLEIWRRSVHDTSISRLYTKIARTKRRAAIAFNNAAIKPLSEVCASMVLLLGTTFWHKSFVALGLGIWIISTLCLLRTIRRIHKSSSPPDSPAAKPAAESNIKQFVSGLFDH